MDVLLSISQQLIAIFALAVYQREVIESLFKLPRHFINHLILLLQATFGSFEIVFS